MYRKFLKIIFVVVVRYSGSGYMGRGLVLQKFTIKAEKPYYRSENNVVFSILWRRICHMLVLIEARVNDWNICGAWGADVICQDQGHVQNHLNQTSPCKFLDLSNPKKALIQASTAPKIHHISEISHHISEIIYCMKAHFVWGLPKITLIAGKTI